MFDIYKEIDELIVDLKLSKYERYSAMLREAKLSGSVATEILALILVELKKCDQEINDKDSHLINKAKITISEIEKIIKLE